MTIINDTNDETLSRITAMRRQEDEVSCCMNYLQLSTNNEIDAKCRTQMVTWCQQVQKALKLSPETVWIAISFFDRYLSSGKGKSRAALQDKYKFQLAAITSFYIAVKLYENVELSVDTLAKLCKGYYAKEDIIDSEEDIIFALDFRLATPTPMEFVRHIMECMLPPELNNNKGLLKAVQKRIEYTSTDIYFTFCKPSVIGASVLTSILVTREILSPTERQTFYLRLSSITDLIDVMEAQNKLITGHTKPVSVSKMVSSSSSSAVTQQKKKPTIISKVADHYAKKTQIVSSGNNSKVADQYVKNKAIVATGNTSPKCIRALPRAA